MRVKRVSYNRFNLHQTVEIMPELDQQTPPLKEVSVKGVRSSNSFRQNLRRAKNKAKSSREKRTLTQKNRRTRTKIRLTMKDTHHGKGRTKTKPTQVKNKPFQTKKRSILKPKYTPKGKTLKRPRRVRWKDQETGSSLVTYNSNKGEFTSRESPLFRNQRPLRMRFTQKRNHRDRDDEDNDRETNIVVRWKIHDEPKGYVKDDILDDVEQIGEMNVEEASKRLREVGIETDRKAPVDLIKNLAILSHGLDNGAIQTRG